jgi:hypothetical protein
MIQTNASFDKGMVSGFPTIDQLIQVPGKRRRVGRPQRACEEIPGCRSTHA